MTINPQELLNSFIDNRSIELISVIGSGSYGIVYLGRYIYADRYYAVKCVSDTNITRNEIEMHSALSGHTNILPLEKVVTEYNRIFIITEYATHGDLFSNITQARLSSKIIGESKIIRHIFLQILDAVEHCHYNMVAHRDLKPENILLLSNYRVKLSDFGLATWQMYSNEFNCGSSFYFSPECQGINTSSATRIPYYNTFANDVWSLGIILINLVCGRNPWKQANMDDNAFKTYVKQPHRFFKNVLPDISKSFERILMRIFCLNPDKRITIPELKIMIRACKSFVWTSSTKEQSECAGSKLECSESLSETMLTYVGDYTDESNNSGELPSTSDNSLKTNGPSTPRNGSPIFNVYLCKLQQTQYELDYPKKL